MCRHQIAGEEEDKTYNANRNTTWIDCNTPVGIHCTRSQLVLLSVLLQLAQGILNLYCMEQTTVVLLAGAQIIICRNARMEMANAT